MTLETKPAELDEKSGVELIHQRSSVPGDGEVFLFKVYRETPRKTPLLFVIWSSSDGNSYGVYPAVPYAAIGPRASAEDVLRAVALAEEAFLQPKPSRREVVDALSAAGLCGDVPAEDPPAGTPIDIPLILGSEGADCGDELFWDKVHQCWVFMRVTGSWEWLPEGLDQVPPELQAALTPVFQRSLLDPATVRRLMGEAPPAEDDLCEECGANISTGYSWEGLCVVCAERHHNIEHSEHAS